MSCAGALLAIGCSSDSPVEYGDDSLRLPATLLEALPLAESMARTVAPNPYVTRLGGGFTVMDADGRARNHTFIFHSRRESASGLIKVTVHLFHGAPWVGEILVGDGPPPFRPGELALDSDRVLARTLQLAPTYFLPPAEAYSARISTIPAWPEPESVDDPGEAIAWRVDLLVRRAVEPFPPVWFSYARFYFDPTTGNLLGSPVIPTEPELYPFP